MSAVDVGPSTAPITSQPQSREPSPPPTSHLDVLPSTVPDAHVSPGPDAVFTQDVPQSQPMTATASTSSQTPNQDDGDGNSAAPYGTRSRNRPGGARPNYADDKELDMEIEAAGRIKAAPKKMASAAPTAEPTPAPLGFATINSTSIQNGDPPAPATTAPPQPAPPKKRKQPASNTPVPNGAAPSHALGPRARPPISNAYVETNMMSFSRCGSRLNAKRQLVADDGTALAANGE